VSDLSHVRKVAVGPVESCALRDGGSVQCWRDSGPREQIPDICGATALAVGQLMMCAIVSGGEVACRGQVLVPGLPEGYSEEVVRIPGITGATSLALGRDGYACALLEAGTVTCWGPRAPSTIAGMSGVVAIAGTESLRMCALLADRSVSCWRSSGAPGPMQAAPAAIEGLSDVVSLSAGQQHSCAVLTDGTVRCWGTNAYGELGDGTQTDSDVPVRVEGLGGVREVSVGTRTSFNMGYSCALLDDSSVACWGAKTTLDLDGDWIASPVPVRMSLP
jgi:alpha-tubulin suppressor-like RCC1 family protein